MLTFFHRRNLFNDDAVAYVNPVNCVGVMGGGIAKQFKDEFPSVFPEYAKACKRGEIRLGEVYVVRRTRKNPEYIIHFPTKHHWRDASSLDVIEQGLISLVETIEQYDLESVAVPALGCGLGGLSWDDVKPLMQQYLAPVSFRHFRVYSPITNDYTITTVKGKTQ